MAPTPHGLETPGGPGSARTTAPADRLEQRLSRAAEVIRLESQTIAGLEARLDARFADAVGRILVCEGLVVVTGVGKAGLVGQKISATLASTGTPSLFLHPTEASHGDLGRLRARDILFAISNSGESAEITALIGPARKIGASIIALTGEPDSLLARHADCVLDIGRVQEACPMNLAPTASTSALLALGDALAMVVLQERAFGREEYALFHPAGSLGRKLMKVREVMRKGEQVPIARSGAKVREVVLVMNRTPGRPGAALIVDAGGKLVGIFTHGDLSRLLERDGLDVDRPVDESMGRTPKFVGPESLVEEAMHVLREHRIDQIPVLDAERRPLGLIDIQDVLDVRV